jgi:Putative zinc-finger
VHYSGPPHNGHAAGEFDVAVDEVTCQQFVELVTDYFEGALEPRTLSQVEEHLVMCDWCVTYVEQMQATITSLRELREERSPGASRPSAGGPPGKEGGRSMIAYKFLRSGRIGMFSAFQWPEPGVWVHAPRDLAPCTRGIHACRPSDLPWWLADELWEIELDGHVRPDEHKIIAPAGRLHAQIEAWTPTCAQAYADACAWRAQERAVQALTRAGYRHEAGQLASCPTLDDVVVATRKLADVIPDGRISLTIAGDGAVRALTGAPPTSAYIAAHAAMRLDGAAGYAAERAWQSDWLVERLGLRTDHPEA